MTKKDYGLLEGCRTEQTVKSTSIYYDVPYPVTSFTYNVFWSPNGKNNQVEQVIIVTGVLDSGVRTGQKGSLRCTIVVGDGTRPTD